MNVGEKVKNLRLKMGLTQEELAERSDLTKGFISQLERGNTSPSVDTMALIVRALGTNLAEFFSETAQESAVYPWSEAVAVTDENLGHTMHFLIANAQTLDMEPVLLEIAPGGRSKSYSPYEGQSYGFVLSGSLVLHLDHSAYGLDASDSFYFAADRPFHIENPGEETGRLLWVLSPPNF